MSRPPSIRRNRPWPLNDASSGAVLARTARRYRRCGRFARHYVASKLRRDPMHEDILLLAGAGGFGAVLDVGCGFGQMGVALLEAGAASSVTGIDRAGRQLAAAVTAAEGLSFQALQRDLSRDPDLPSADTVLLLDVLYQLDPAAQQNLLRRIVAAARSRILVRMMDPDQGLRSAAVRAMERLFRRIWPTAGSAVHPGSPTALADHLRDCGFDVAVAPCARGTPFTNVLLVAARVRTRSGAAAR